ncbi:hypothetical protein DIC66_19110 [Rhodoferax lacus]|uniref:Zinc finger/thioredoxin putative domain-containing protein n=1 Tax=Rhodoferax lacus TaxID=2184758 RepID=A0A3E1R7Q0_9BURK|nr:zinc-ribbon and DUF3426 domain-containing protein [Rhodoferax lacus]RFO95337.1 hypothetical protein DIC66_19110 [Rhodoferax lacus]
MSLITQCPACSTMFRVVPDQLRISEGWVRCGQCDEVFDANAHLRSLEEPLSAYVPAPVPSPHPSAPSSHTPPAWPEPQAVAEPASSTYASTVMMPVHANTEPAYDWGAVLADSAQATPLGAYEPDPMTGTEADAAPEPQAYSLETDPLLMADLHSEAQAAGSSISPALSALEDDWAPTVYAGLATGDADAEQAKVAPSQVPPDDPAPSFMESANRVPNTGSWLGRKALFALCSVLGLLLVVQVLFLERDRIAAASPALHPLLLAGCELLACTVSAPRDIESIAIDSSAFTSVRPGVYLLHATLKNSAATALATPALEITLTDTQDKPVLRRVLMPGELSDKASMSAGAELVTTLPVSVKPGATPEKIAGYKLLAFYP